MCGIAGYINIQPSAERSEDLIQIMTDAAAHRGPDDKGYRLLSFDGEEGGADIAFGHRRLSIIDLSPLGHQPMANRDGSLWIIFNGEIYNYVELREELRTLGHEFISTSDTEVILKAYEEWGTACFARFNGMWALALLDKRRRTVVLSRDRLGKKPLYYYRSSSLLVFGSEIKSLLQHPAVPREPNVEKVFRYLSTNYRYLDLDNASYFKDIFYVPKASFVEIDEHLHWNEQRYWQLEDNIVPRDIPEAQAIDELRDLLTDAVRIRLRSDVPVGCFLSGGMDSTSITCIAYHVLKQPIITFSGVTGDVKGVYDESEYINSVIRHIGAEAHFIRPDPADIFETVNEMLNYHDEPVCTVTWYSLYLIAKKIRQEKVPVMLNGHGGDEILAGYWDYYQYNFHDLEQAGDTATLQEEIRAWAENHHRDMSEIDRYKTYIGQLERGETSEMSRFPDYSFCFKEDVVRQYKRDIHPAVPALPSLLSRRMYSDLMYETVQPVLRVEDRNTMAQSIESRSPFLDYRLAEFCFSLPNTLKIRNGTGKWMLREAMKGILPEDVRTRKDKAGFIAPADEWFRTTNRQQIYDLINSEELKSRDLFDIERLNILFDEHCRGEKNHAMFLWQLINAELWFRKFFDSAVA